jgi:hypothetical protein
MTICHVFTPLGQLASPVIQAVELELDLVQDEEDQESLVSVASGA